MNHNCVKSCCDYRSCWGVDSVVVVGEVAVGFAVEIVDY